MSEDDTVSSVSNPVVDGSSVSDTIDVSIDDTGGSLRPSLSPIELELVDVYEQFWMLHGRTPKPDELAILGYDLEAVTLAVGSEHFREAVNERGVVFTARSFGILHPEQLAVANVLLDLTDTRARKKKLSDLGVSTAKYQAWLRDPHFQSYLKARAEALLGDSHHDADLALLDAVRSGNLNAIDYYNELTGRHVRPSRTAAGGRGFDAQILISRIIEIIQEEVKDPQTQARLADRFDHLLAANAYAAGLTNPEPKAVTSKAPTPETDADKLTSILGLGKITNA